MSINLSPDLGQSKGHAYSQGLHPHVGRTCYLGQDNRTLGPSKASASSFCSCCLSFPMLLCGETHSHPFLGILQWFMKERVPFKGELAHPQSAGMSLFRASPLIRYWEPETAAALRSSWSKVESPILSSPLRTEAVPNMEKRGITAPSSSSVSCYRLPPPPTRVLWPQRARCSWLGSGGRKGEGGTREHIWHCVSHKNTAAASLALLGLMRGGVTATLNSG